MSNRIPVNAGAVVAGILEAASADDVLRSAFPEAQRRGAPLHVVAAVDAATVTVVERWAEKYPDVAVTIAARPGIDGAIMLAAAARGCALLITAEPVTAHDAAVLRAVTRRVRCPLSLLRAAGAARVPR